MSDEIKNPNTEEDQPDLMTLEDEDGNEITFEVIDALDHKGVHYLAAVEYAETEEEAENAQLVILSVGEDDEGEYLDVVDDDELLLELGRRGGLPLGGKLLDCGCMVFDNTAQDVHAGGSGCGCSAITLCGELLGKLAARKLKRILFCGTGALLSPTSTQQGLPIPGVCHAVVIEGGQ